MYLSFILSMIFLPREKPISESSLNGLVELLTDDAVKLTYMVPDFPNRREAEKLARRLICLSEQKERHVVGIYYEDALIGILNETDSMDRRKDRLPPR